MQSATYAAQSLAVLNRAALKLAVFTFAAAVHGLVGLGFLRTLSTLALLAGILGVMMGQWRHERPLAPHYTHFDEAAWFIMLGLILRRLM